MKDYKIELYENKREDRIKDAIIKKLIVEVEKTKRELGYYFWRHN